MDVHTLNKHAPISLVSYRGVPVSTSSPCLHDQFKFLSSCLLSWDYIYSLDLIFLKHCVQSLICILFYSYLACTYQKEAAYYIILSFFKTAMILSFSWHPSTSFLHAYISAHIHTLLIRHNTHSDYLKSINIRTHVQISYRRSNALYLFHFYIPAMKYPNLVTRTLHTDPVHREVIPIGGSSFPNQKVFGKIPLWRPK